MTSTAWLCWCVCWVKLTTSFEKCHLWLSSHIFHVMLFIDQSVVITCFCWLVFHFISVRSNRPLNYSLGPMWWIACLFVTLKISQLWIFLIKFCMNNYSINSKHSLNHYFQGKCFATQVRGITWFTNSSAICLAQLICAAIIQTYLQDNL